MHLPPLSQQVLDWMEKLANQYSYFGVFLISLIGSLSIIFPVPYTIVIYLLGTVLDPFLIAISAGLGAAIGEILGYTLGYYGRAVVGKEQQRKMDYMLKVFSHYGTIAIFFFALTPLPDDLLFIPLGMMRYNFTKFFIPCLLGKTLMFLVIAIGGRLSIGVIRDIFGEAGWWTTIVAAALLVAIVVIMVKVDWEKIFTKYVEKSKKKSSRKSRHQCEAVLGIL